MIIEKLGIEEYHALPSVSKSGLELVLRSPAHYKNRDAFSGTRNTTIGTAAHAAIFEPELFTRDYVLLAGVNDRRAKEYKDAVKARGDENFVLVHHEWQSIAGLAKSIRSNPDAAAILKRPGRAELSVITKDPITGLEVRIRPDWVTNCGKMLDLKTTIDARASHFTRAVINYKYHMQNAFYIDAWQWEFAEKPEFTFLAVEKIRPHANKLYKLDALAIEVGRSMYRTALNIYAECLEKDKWPAYCGETETIGLPEWAFNDDDIDIGGDNE